MRPNNSIFFQLCLIFPSHRSIGNTNCCYSGLFPWNSLRKVSILGHIAVSYLFILFCVNSRRKSGFTTFSLHADKNFANDYFSSVGERATHKKGQGNKYNELTRTTGFRFGPALRRLEEGHLSGVVGSPGAVFVEGLRDVVGGHIGVFLRKRRFIAFVL